MASISLANVQKSYANGQAVIRNAQLEVGKNEFCVFLGPSGCGKSTLLRMIAGLESISDGELRIDGQRMNDVAPAQRRVAMVFQNYALYPHMSVYENMAFGLRQAKIDKALIDTKVRRAAAALQLDALLERRPAALSGGQRQRVAIGRAIVREPGVFLFDEPLSNLDAALRVQTRTEIARLHREFREASAVYVTHDQVEAMALADRIVLLQAGTEMEQHGSIAQVGAPLDLYHHPRSRFVAGFIGSPKMNFFAGTIASADVGGVHVTLDSGERVLARVEPGHASVGMKVTLGIRPEHLRLADSVRNAPTLACRVRLVERMGEHSYVHLVQPRAGSATLIAKLPGDSALAFDENVTIALPPEACHLFDDRDMAFKRMH
ncbi:multiple sugar transport system ATP-binding protein [Paraburkholderia tropica]|uniref:ABC transporter ATP-binding protein n=1 Tax=Paraburkholderia tropica TaxID=92647 RepID=UPI0016228F1B|nr:sn-glycerol-3-phosphate ABC transporter ATP-binding protein UgpC [Paraburkholderia tropica]MBB3001414.1 multiple sugar transport system ATP-binding protein [Paraburkholderia tropica]MBB6323310.1 multiple sugar transport system ATP-binding protein [Paraburkholderia tropica]